jgi:hypothetical protein
LNAGLGCCHVAFSFGGAWGCDPFTTPDFLPSLAVELLLLLLAPHPPSPASHPVFVTSRGEELVRQSFHGGTE